MKTKQAQLAALAVYLTSFLSYQHFLPQLLLGEIYQWYEYLPQQQVVLLVTIPLLLTAAVNLWLSRVLHRANKKTLLLLGLSTIFLGGITLVCSGGQWFIVSLSGTMLQAFGYAIILSTTGAALTELFPNDASRALGINGPVGCAGSIIMFYLAGRLSADGYWPRVFLLNLPTLIPLLAVMLFYHPLKTSIDGTQGPIVPAVPTQTAARTNHLPFIIVLTAHALYMLALSSWNLNYSSYIILEKQIGAAADAGMAGIAASIGGVIGGLLIVAPMRKLLKQHTAPLCILVTGLSFLTIVLGTSQLFFIYGTAFLFMLLYEPIRTQNIASASCVLPDSATIPLVNAVGGVSNFLAPYIINTLGEIGGGTIPARVTVGILFTCISAGLLLLSAPKSKKQPV